MKLLLASSNQGKLAEFRQLLAGIDLVLWPADAPSLPETGAFFSVSPAAIRETSYLVFCPSTGLLECLVTGAS